MSSYDIINTYLYCPPTFYTNIKNVTTGNPEIGLDQTNTYDSTGLKTEIRFSLCFPPESIEQSAHVDGVIRRYVRLTSINRTYSMAF